MQETQENWVWSLVGKILVSGRSPGEEMATHSSILACKNPKDREDWVATDWEHTHTHTHTHTDLFKVHIFSRCGLKRVIPESAYLWIYEWLCSGRNHLIFLIPLLGIYHTKRRFQNWSVKHMKRCLMIWFTREIQMKTTKWNPPSAPARTSKIKKTDHTECWWGCRTPGILTWCRWGCKILQPHWKKVWQFILKSNIYLYPLCWEPSFNPWTKGMATHSSILAWRIAWTEEPGGLQSMGSQRVGHDGATNTSILIPYNPATPLLRVYLREQKTYPCKDLCLHIHS